jgi:hypothetical protein
MPEIKITGPIAVCTIGSNSRIELSTGATPFYFTDAGSTITAVP